jgi:hypothetical protein
VGEGDKGTEDRDDRATEDRKYDQLLAFCKALYDSETARFDAAELKVGRYTTLAAALGAGIAIGVPHVLNLLRAQASVGPMAKFFLTAYGLTLVASVIGFVSFYLSMRVQRIASFPKDETEPLRAVDGRDYMSAVDTFARAYLDAAFVMRRLLKTKYGLVQVGYWALGAAVLFAVIGGISYVSLELGYELDLSERNVHDER